MKNKMWYSLVSVEEKSRGWQEERKVYGIFESLWIFKSSKTFSRSLKNLMTVFRWVDF